MAATGAVIATVGLMSTSAEPRNTSVSRQNDCKQMQVELKTGTVQPLTRVYTDGESNGNWAWVFEAACKLVQSEFRFALPDRVLQVQANFNDAIEYARRQNFPRSRPANDYPHMKRAA